MEQRDYLLRQIKQLGQVLALMLARLLNLKQVPPAGLSLEEIKQVYSNETDLWEKSIYIFEYLQDITGTYSLDRMLKITQLKDRLNVDDNSAL